MNAKRGAKRSYVPQITLLLLVSLFACISCASALTIIPNNATVSKNTGVNAVFSLTIANTNALDFYNITLVNNSIASIPLIPQLNGNTNQTLDLTIFTNQPGIYQLRFRGSYLDTVPNTNPIIKDVAINQNNSVYSMTPCTFSVTRGDSVRWTNNLNSQVVLRDASGAPLPGATINAGQQFSLVFNNVGDLTYYSSISSFPIGNICTITTLNDTGYISDPAEDGVFNLTVAVNVPPTTLDVNVPVTSYNITFDGSQDGVMSITNTGSQTAFAVHLSGEWLTYSLNDFDLTPGQTKGIIYTIRPSVTASNQTGITYTKNIRITGNFNEINKPLSIFIPSAILTGGNSSDLEYLRFLHQVYCPAHPTSIFCSQAPINNTVYVQNGSLANIGFNLTADQIISLFTSIGGIRDSVDTTSNFVKQEAANNALNNSVISQSLQNITDTVSSEQRSRIRFQNAVMIIAAAFLGAVGISCTLFIVYRKNRGSKLKWSNQ